MIKIATLGCLANRNCAHYFDAKFVRNVLYAPKLSLTALSGAPIGLPKSASGQLDSFRRGVVSRDFEKTFWTELKEKAADFLIIDFAEEIHDVVYIEEKNTFITKSDYLDKLGSPPLFRMPLQLILNGSARFRELWVDACHDFSKRVSALNITNILFKLYVPEYFIAESGVERYSDIVLEKIKDINARLDWYYSTFTEHVSCHVIDVPSHLQASQFSKGKKPGIADYALDLSEYLAERIARMAALENYLIPSSRRKVDMYLNGFSDLLDAGDIPSIYEIYTRGKELRRIGDERGAIRCERLITLLRNSSVPLSADLGKVSFGYGGIGVIIHAAAKLGDYVNIGSNVTIGGGTTRIDKNGRARQIPVIGDRVYIGTGSKIIGGIEIGSHSIIGANAVVTTDIPPYSVVAGIPGKVVSSITPHNLYKYSGYLYKGLSVDDVKKAMFD